MQDTKTIKQRAKEYPFDFSSDEAKAYIEIGYIGGATEQKVIDKKKAHEAFVELLAVQYGEDCDESMHQYIDDVLNKVMGE